MKCLGEGDFEYCEGCVGGTMGIDFIDMDGGHKIKCEQSGDQEPEQLTCKKKDNTTTEGFKVLT